MLTLLKKAFQKVIDFVTWSSEGLIRTNEEYRNDLEKKWDEMARQQHVYRPGHKRPRDNDLVENAGSSHKKSSSSVQPHTPTQSPALVPAPPNTGVGSRQGGGAATNAAAAPDALHTAASDEPQEIVERVYEGDTLESLQLSEELADLVHRDMTLMCEVHTGKWHLGKLQCRKARINPHGGWTFLMNFTYDSHTVELEHWFSKEDLEYIHDLDYRGAMVKETRHYGVLKPT